MLVYGIEMMLWLPRKTKWRKTTAPALHHQDINARQY